MSFLQSLTSLPVKYTQIKVTRLVACLVISLFNLVFLFGIIQPLAAQSNSSFPWKLTFYQIQNSSQKAVEVSRPITFNDGDTFGLEVSITEKNKQAFCYVIFEDSVGNATFLYSGECSSAQKLSLPPNNELYKLQSPSGTDKVHIVISEKEQSQLIKYQKLLEQPSNVNSVSVQLFDEIKRIKQDNSSIIEKPVKPATTGGTTRSFGKTKQEPYVEFSGSSEYVKTIRLKH